ncbi:MAG: cell envelope integrity protein TolA, partial [Gammaproteobacteria bacterium]
RKEAEKKKKAEEEKKRKEAEKKKKAEEEKKRKAQEKKKAEEEKKRKEAEKKKKEAEAKAEQERQAEEKRKAEQEKKRIEEERKKREAEEKERIREAEEAQRQQDEQDAVSAFGAVAWAIQEQVRGNWNQPAGDFNGMSVSFTIRVDREGNVTSVKMSRSSGNARLDESAENAIYKASPLPIPSEARFYEYLKEFEFVFSPQS